MAKAAWERLGEVLLSGGICAVIGWLIFSAVHRNSPPLKWRLGMMVLGFALLSYLGTGIAFVVATRHIPSDEPLYSPGVAGFGMLVGLLVGNLLQPLVSWLVGMPPADEMSGPTLPKLPLGGPRDGIIGDNRGIKR